MTIPGPPLVHSKATLQVKYLFVLMVLIVPRTMAEVPGPCRHSITKEHLLTVRNLIDNQLRSGCSINYTFIERRSLSKCCFVKAALPWILELLSTHFKYNRRSVNYSYVQSIRALVLNIYSQKCVPQINEEIEDKPESFEMLYRGSPTEALQRAAEVLSVYRELVTTSSSPVDWRCQHEYSELFSSTTEFYSETPAYFTDSYDRMSAKASQKRLVKNLYTPGLILISVSVGLLMVLTLYCLITQKRTSDRQSSNQRGRDIEMDAA